MKTTDKVIALGLALGAIVMGIAALGVGPAAALPTKTANGYKMLTFLVEVERDRPFAAGRVRDAAIPEATRAG